MEIFFVLNVGKNFMTAFYDELGVLDTAFPCGPHSSCGALLLNPTVHGLKHCLSSLCQRRLSLRSCRC